MNPKIVLHFTVLLWELLETGTLGKRRSTGFR